MSDHLSTKFNEISISEDPHFVPLSGNIRSERMLLYDAKRWGYYFGLNKKRPYFEGHERADVIKHRDEFVSYFIERKMHYFIIDDEKNTWITPSYKPCIILFHDESTFRSGEQYFRRLFKENNEPFCNKG